MENQQQPSQTSLCRAGCGFYGSSSTEGLCSKCFKDSIQKKQDRLSPAALNAAENAKCVADKLREVVAQSHNSDLQAQIEAAVAKMGGSESPASSLKVEAASTISSSSSSASLLSAPSDVAMVDVSPASTSSTPTPTKKPNRCQVCKKRVGLTGFPCRCGGLYCGEHRYDTAHECQFDYKTAEREELRKNNPVVMSEKIQRL